MQEVFRELLHGFGILSVYFIIAASTVLLCRFLIKIPNEIFRKTLHFVLLGSVFVFVYGFETWWVSALAAIIFEIIVYPILMVVEHIKNFSEFTTERKKGELKSSLLLVFTMFAFVISVCWGMFHDKILVIASILAWGIGDAFAALVGKRFGKHKIKDKFTDGKKSYEGTLAMFVSSFVTVTVVMTLHGGLNPAGYIIIPFVTAAVSALAELYSKNGLDTVICPVAAMIVVDGLTCLFGGVAL
ncbi:MAG: phosphatidate cytidylyltransferase [Clostridia bacterium]|nr:phosphatidate cytidylyltransferase [Clostridia bacterium]